MNAVGAGIATGFFNTQAGGMETRRDGARDYFNKQVDIARTAGVANKARVGAAVDSGITAARKLEAMGVPHDIILAQANMDPAGLDEFYNQVVKLSANANVPINEQFFRDSYGLSKEIANPNEDFATFFTRMYDPIVTAAESDPEGLKDNPKGTIWANAFGYNQMDKARNKLSTTMVAPGLTAEQAIQYGDQTVPSHPLGDVTVIPNIENMKTYSADTSIDEMNSADKTFEGLPEIVMLDPRFAGLDEAGIREEVLRRVVSLYGNNPAIMEHLQIKYGFTLSDGPSEAVGGPTEGVDTSEPPPTAEPTTPPVETPTEPLSTEPLDPSITMSLERLGFSDFVDNGDGTTTYKKDGEQYTSSNDQMRQALIYYRDSLLKGE